jgi:hypothetical protein
MMEKRQQQMLPGEGGTVSRTPSLAGVSFLSRSPVISGPNWA